MAEVRFGKDGICDASLTLFSLLFGLRVVGTVHYYRDEGLLFKKLRFTVRKDDFWG